jgi:hypothetical protein
MAKIPDYKPQPLEKFERPCFSPQRGSYEIDFANTAKEFNNIFFNIGLLVSKVGFVVLIFGLFV